jgi:hypothetical protein
LPLWKKFMMHNPKNVTKKLTQNEQALHIWMQVNMTCSPHHLLGTELTGSCTDTAAWFLASTCKFTSHRPQLTLNGVWHLSKPLLMFLSCADNSPSAPHLASGA